MFHFCFNDCFPKNSSEHLLISSLSATLGEFAKIKKKFPEEISGIITINTPQTFLLNIDGFSLLNSIQGLERSLRIIAFSFFTKYPVENNLPVDDQDDLILNDYSIKVDNTDYDAMNAKIVYDSNGILFTLAVHIDLEKNTLAIIGKDASVFEVSNLFGEDENTKYITDLVSKSLEEKYDNFEKLLSIVGTSKVHDRFEKSFKSASKEVQISVIEYFQTAINRKGVTPFYADREIIKDVTPEKENIVKVYELRIFTPVAFRVYFYEADQIYLALMEKKPNDKVQTGHIETAKSLIKELVLVS